MDCNCEDVACSNGMYAVCALCHACSDPLAALSAVRDAMVIAMARALECFTLGAVATDSVGSSAKEGDWVAVNDGDWLAYLGWCLESCVRSLTAVATVDGFDGRPDSDNNKVSYVPADEIFAAGTQCPN